MDDDNQSAESKTVLVVDDEILIRMMVVDALLDAGYACEEASSADEALRALDRDPQIALMITDIGISGQHDGHWLANEARNAKPGLPVMLMSGYGNAAEMAGGEFTVLSKPFDIAQLIAQVRAHLVSG